MRNSVIAIFILVSYNLFAQNQRVGIGTPDPEAPLHIKCSTCIEMIRLEGLSPFISFYDNWGYRGFLKYNTDRMELATVMGSGLPVVIAPGQNPVGYFTSDGKLGLGIENPLEELDVNGSVNLTGKLKINGVSGTPGQVLASNGDNPPQWKNAAFSNNIRFAVSFTHSATSSGGYARITQTRYNLNTTDVIIGASSITIKRSGLYHFDLYITARSVYSSAQTTIYPYFSFFLNPGTPHSYELIYNKTMQSDGSSNTSWWMNEKVSLELHITAPLDITFSHVFATPLSSYFLSGYLTGHLISE